MSQEQLSKKKEYIAFGMVVQEPESPGPNHPLPSIEKHPTPAVVTAAATRENLHKTSLRNHQDLIIQAPEDSSNRNEFLDFPVKHIHDPTSIMATEPHYYLNQHACQGNAYAHYTEYTNNDNSRYPSVIDIPLQKDLVEDTFGEMLCETPSSRNTPLVVLDCANIGWNFGSTIFNAKGVHIAIEFFRAMQIEVQAFIPASYLRAKPRNTQGAGGQVIRGNALMVTEDVEILTELAERKLLTTVPAGDSDDAYILNYARDNNGFVISNDLFNDHQNSITVESVRKSMRIWLQDHRCGYTFTSHGEFIFNPTSELRAVAYRYQLALRRREHLSRLDPTSHESHFIGNMVSTTQSNSNNPGNNTCVGSERGKSVIDRNTYSTEELVSGFPSTAVAAACATTSVYCCAPPDLTFQYLIIGRDASTSNNNNSVMVVGGGGGGSSGEADECYNGPVYASGVVESGMLVPAIRSISEVIAQLSVLPGCPVPHYSRALAAVEVGLLAVGDGRVAGLSDSDALAGELRALLLARSGLLVKSGYVAAAIADLQYLLAYVDAHCIEAKQALFALQQRTM